MAFLATLLALACEDGPEVEPSPPPAATDVPATTRTPAPALPATVTASTTPAANLFEGLIDAPQGRTEDAVVTGVTDGDTIRVLLGGHEYAVRYIGVDAPETRHPSQAAGYCGREAAARNAELVPVASTIILERDISETDRYGRLLRYVWSRVGMAGAILLAEGLAVVSTYPPDIAWVEEYLVLQEYARERGRGVWGSADCRPVTDVDSGGPCEPAYPGVCIPPPPPDLDCADVPYRRFRVLPPDPHNFDADRNGWGCEGVRP